MKRLLTILSIVMCLTARSQQTLTTIGGWNAYVHLPYDYSNGENKTYPLILTFPGLGEVGTDASELLINSPSSWINDGWNGNVFVDGDSVRFIVITIQPSSAYPSESTIQAKLTAIKAAYRVGDITLAGFSHGGWCAKTFITGDPLGGPYSYVGQIKNVVDVQGMLPDDNSPYPNLFDNFALAATDKFYLGFEQSNDNRAIPTLVSRMNAARAGTARYLTTTFGGGVHGYAERFYGGDGTTTNQTPGVFTIDGISQTMYEWIARHVQADTAIEIIEAGPCNEAAPVKYILGPTSGNQINITDANLSRPWKGGDTIEIATGVYSLIHIDSLRGDSCRPINIRFQPGVVDTGAFRLNYGYYIDVDGYSDTSTRYHCGPRIRGLSAKRVKYFNFEYVEIAYNNSTNPIYCKIDVDPLDSSTWRSSGFVMRKIRFDHLYIHDVDGECYVGHTSPAGDEYHADSLGNLIPAILLDSVEVSYCRVERSGWDGLQVSGAGDGAKIHHNYVERFGLLDLPGQKAGIILGSLTNGDVYNNTVKNGLGNGIQVFGYGVVNVYNNIIDSVAQTRGDSNEVTHQWKGEQSFYGDDRDNEDKPALQVNFYNNTIKHYSPYENGAVSIPNGNGTMGVSSAHDNVFTIPGANPATWQTKHIKLYPGFLNYNNVLTGQASSNKTRKGIIRFKN